MWWNGVEEHYFRQWYPRAKYSFSRWFFRTYKLTKQKSERESKSANAISGTEVPPPRRLGSTTASRHFISIMNLNKLKHYIPFSLLNPSRLHHTSFPKSDSVIPKAKNLNFEINPENFKRHISLSPLPNWIRSLGIGMFLLEDLIHCLANQTSRECLKATINFLWKS